jgi:hypothetical protein
MDGSEILSQCLKLSFLLGTVEIGPCTQAAPAGHQEAETGCARERGRGRALCNDLAL